MAESKCFVITCNDSVEHVFIGRENHAQQMMEGLSTKYYMDRFRHTGSRDDYDRRVHWACRLTPYTIGEGLVLHVEG